MADKNPSSRIFYFDLIRAYAIFLVVFSHVFAPLVWGFNSIPLRTWFVINFFDAMIRPCVPLFVMISGALILKSTREETIFQFLRRRLSKILIPLIIWSLLYGLYQSHTSGETFSLKELIVRGLQEPIQYHLWFMYMLLGIYFLVPILRVLVKRAQKSELKYFLVVWFLSTTLPMVVGRLYGFQLNSAFFILSGHVGYFVLGYFLSDLDLNSRQVPYIALTIVALTLFSFLGTYILVLRGSGTMDEFFYQYLAPNTIVLSSCLFLYLKFLSTTSFVEGMTWFKSIAFVISKYSFGIYLMHMMVLNLLASGFFGFTLTESTFQPIIGVFLTTFSILLISTLSTMLIQKIPLVRISIP